MPQTTITLKFRAVYEQGLSQNPGNKEELYRQYYYPGMADYVADLQGDPPSTIKTEIDNRFPLVSNLDFTDVGGVPIFTGDLTVSYEAGSQSFTQLLPYVTGDLRLNQNPQEWVPSEDAQAALVTLLNSILWVPPWPNLRIIGIFNFEYTHITIVTTDVNGNVTTEEYPVSPHGDVYGIMRYRSSGGAGGGLR